MFDISELFMKTITQGGKNRTMGLFGNSLFDDMMEKKELWTCSFKVISKSWKRLSRIITFSIVIKPTTTKKHTAVKGTQEKKYEKSMWEIPIESGMEFQG